MLGILRNVMSNAPETLPTWDDVDRKFSDGLLLFAAGVVYALPVLIALFLPLSIAAYSILVSGNSNLQDIGRVITEARGVLFYVLVCGLVLYGVGLSIIYPAILVVYAREGTFASCFKLGEVLKMISRNIAPFFTAWGLSWVAGLGVGLLVGLINLVVGWVPCLGWVISLALSLVSRVYLTAVYAHLFGQFGRTVFAGNEPAAII
jgi:hypothetical protein